MLIQPVHNNDESLFSSQMITHQPVIDESDAPSTTLAAISPKDDGTTAASPDDVSTVGGVLQDYGGVNYGSVPYN